MQILLSPAKSLAKLPAEAIAIQTTTPKFVDRAGMLVEKLREFSVQDLQKGQGLSEKLAMLNKKRYQDWTSRPGREISAPAAQLFNGEVYRGLAVSAWSPEDWEFAQNHLLILSGLYGLLRPLDHICAYRLEMGNRMLDLYTFWKGTLLQELNHSSGPLVNLASNEYAKVIDRKALNRPWVEVDFYETTSQGPKIIGVHAKKARGRMASYLILNRITQVEDLKEFHEEGYSFDAERSSPNHFIFVR